MTENYLTVEQAAERLQIAPYTLRDWLKSGRVSGVKIGRLWRVPPSALDQLQSTPAVASTRVQSQVMRVSAQRNPLPDASSRLARFEEFLDFAKKATIKTKPLADNAVERTYREREDRQA